MTRAHRLLWLTLTTSCTAAAAPVAVAPSPLRYPASPAMVDSLLASLTVRQKVAQLVVPWLLGNYTASDDSVFLLARRWVRDLEVGGIIISIGSPHDVAAKLNALQQASRLPLLVSADLEYGAGMRLTGGTAFPSLMAVGATGEALDAYTIGRAAALEGRAAGIHLDFAPVADVNNNPANPIINTRAFGEDPEAVGRLVTAFVRGLREHGMLSTLKHFPGHGDTEIDSHIGLPVIRADYARLDSVELVPFRAGIAAGADVVMSAHIAFPEFTGTDDPATLSPDVLTGLLRDSLGFRGIVVTDALVMGAIVARYGAGEAAVRAFLAGSDFLLMPADPDSAIMAMVAAVEGGRVTPDRLDRSVRRMLEAKATLGLFTRRTVPLDSVMDHVGTREFQLQAQDIAARALTLVRDTSGTFRALRGGPRRLALIAYGDELNGSVGNQIAEGLRAGGDSVEQFRLWPMSGPLSYDSARAVVARAPAVVFAASVRPVSWKGFIALPDSLARFVAATDSVKPTLLVSLGSPYLLNQVPTVGAYLIAWSGARAAERAVAQAILGYIPITGRLPIRIPPSYPIGHGIRVTEVRAPATP